MVRRRCEQKRRTSETVDMAAFGNLRYIIQKFECEQDAQSWSDTPTNIPHGSRKVKRTTEEGRVISTLTQGGGEHEERQEGHRTQAFRCSQTGFLTQGQYQPIRPWKLCMLNTCL